MSQIAVMSVRPSQGCEVAKCVENCEDFEPPERVEGEDEGAEDGAENAQTKAYAEALYSGVPGET